MINCVRNLIRNLKQFFEKIYKIYAAFCDNLLQATVLNRTKKKLNPLPPKLLMMNSHTFAHSKRIFLPSLKWGGGGRGGLNSSFESSKIVGLLRQGGQRGGGLQAKQNNV